MAKLGEMMARLLSFLWTVAPIAGIACAGGALPPQPPAPPAEKPAETAGEGRAPIAMPARETAFDGPSTMPASDTGVVADPETGAEGSDAQGSGAEGSDAGGNDAEGNASESQDATFEEVLTDALRQHPLIDMDDLDVDVERGGMVVFRGTVASLEAYSALIRTAHRLGARHIVDKELYIGDAPRFLAPPEREP